MKTVGILGGSSPVATVEYYRLINAGIQARLGGVASGEIILSSINFAQADDFVNANEWEAGARYLNPKAKSLERAGADFVIMVSNTLHHIADEIMAGVRIPLLHIADPTGLEMQRLGLKKVALLGTKATMSLPFLATRYQNKFAIDICVPDPSDQEEINRVIFTELALANFKPESKAIYLRIVDSLVARGAQGIIFGCTEIGLLIEQKDRPNVPMLDTMGLHTRAVVNKMLE